MVTRFYNRRMQKTIHSEKYSTLVSWLQACRYEKGLSMRQLAAKLTVPHSVIAKVEQMERRLDVYEYVQYCEALEIDPFEGMELLIAD